MSASLDYFVSLLGSWELFRLYHHFIMVDDVAYLDDMGVPRRKDGDLACLVEYSSTPQCAFHTVWGPSGRGFAGLLPFLLDKCSYNVMPLVDYCDMPHIFLQLPQEALSDSQRDEIVQRALDFHTNHPTFNVFRRNCEHSTNDIVQGQAWRSPQVGFVFWNGFQTAASLVGAVFLYSMGIFCYDQLCFKYPVGALFGYHLFTSVPVMLRSIIHLFRAVYHLNRHMERRDSPLSRDDYCHLVGKEIGRFMTVGVGSVVVIGLLPTMILDTGHVVAACMICLVAFMICNLLFSVLAQSFTRLLVDRFGKAWLL
eukprot:TRINITY_DN3932_c0_g2_i7.p1 TRINITY_DN3932_c0_g2~~TRINITY_DN3932_c0_g2_i7.p1  ORF type:complete len:311 (+),score=57.49 TRINITY_DN3932_c0_g2_i7:451-1383(+)